jgi:exopolyphosphatase/pppGpp-phosphohydrolase
LASNSEDSNLVAALDIGSNTIRLLVARPNERQLETVLDDSRFVRLGKGVDASGKLAPDRVEAALQAMAELVDEAKSYGAATIRVVATSAVRDAENRQEFVERARDEVHVDMEILSGEAEARLTYLGATLGLTFDGGAIVCDIGGGSVELISAESGNILWEESLQLGCGRLTELFVHHDPPTDEERDAIVARFQDALLSVPSARPHVAVFTGGTASHVAYLTGYTSTPAEIPVAEVRRLEELVYSTPSSGIASKYNIKPERAEVLPAGVTSLLVVAGFYEVDPVTITRSGIREGVLVDTWQSLGLWPE